MNKLKVNFLSFKRQSCLLKSLLMLAGLALSFGLEAQGWEIYFGGNAVDQATSVIQTKDSGYALVGFSESFGSDNDLDVYVVRTDIDGKEIWSNVYDEGYAEHGYAIVETPDLGLLILGDIKASPSTPPNVYLIKVDAKGELQWSKQYGGAGSDVGYRIIPAASNDGYLLVGKTNSMGNGQEDVFLIKVDENGNQQWTKTYGTTGDDAGKNIVSISDGYLITGYAANNIRDVYLLKVDFNGDFVWEKFFGGSDFDEANDIITLNDGNVAIVGYTGSNSDVYLIKTNLAGEEIWAKTIGDTLIDLGAGLVQADNGDIVLVGSTEVSASDINILLARVDSDGNEVWTHNFGRNTFSDLGQGIAKTQDGGFIIGGYNSPYDLIIINDYSLVKVSSQGTIYTNHLIGQVFIDANEDCQLQISEPGLTDWIIKAESPTKTFFGTSDSTGHFDITIDTGTYQVSVLVKNNYWESCVALYNVNFTNFYDTLVRNFPIIPEVDCPLLTVDVSAPVVQNCSNIGYVISYCNSGTQAAGNSSVEIILDNDLMLTSSSIPWTFNQDSLYVFDIGTIGLDKCGTFNFTVASDCSGIPSQAYTVSAHIYPDSICTVPDPNWDMASIVVNGYCDSDSVRFNIKNEGIGNMQQTQYFIVIEDNVMFTPEPVPFGILEVGEDTTITIAVTNGYTYRIIAEQSPGHPGNSYPTVAVEGCTMTPGSFSTGYTTELQENENDPFISIDVQEAIASTDYILLRGYPKGYLKNGEYLIPANTDIEYHLYFRNAGSDTVSRLVIRDTLPASLDLGTVVAGASSHPYEFEVYSNGVLKFTFDSLQLLPDAQGFVQFKVSQKPNNPEGTVIPNSATVFLGYDAPVQTDTYTHVVGGKDLLDFIVVKDTTSSTGEPFVKDVKVSAYPNPFASAIEFEVTGKDFNTLKVCVFDIYGRLVCCEESSGNHLRLQRDKIPTGTYTYRLESGGSLLSTGKIIAH